MANEPTNAQGLTVQQMSQAAANPQQFGLSPAQQTTIQQSQANPGTLVTGGQTGTTPAGQLPQQAINFQAQTSTPETQRQAGIQEVARLNGISLEEASQRYDRATNRPTNLPPGTVYNPATGQVTDPRTGMAYAGSTGPDYSGMRFVDPGSQGVTGAYGTAGALGSPMGVQGSSTPFGTQGTFQTPGGASVASGATLGSQEQGTNGFEKTLSDLNAKTDEAFKGYQTSIQQLQSGTFPLSPDEQFQVDAMQQRFAAMQAAQVAANARYQGGLTQAGISSGRSRYAPEIEMGNLQTSINNGLAKVRDIEFQGMEAMSKLKDGFKERNYALINDQYEKLDGYLKEKKDTVSGMMKSVMDHEEKMTELQQKADKETFDQMMASATLDQNVKMDEFEMAMRKDTFDAARKKEIHDQMMADKGFDLSEKKTMHDIAMSDASFSETQKKNAADKWKDEQDIAIRKQATDPYDASGTGGGIGAVPVKIDDVTGIPNKGQQANFLSKLPSDKAVVIKGLTDYKSNPKNISIKTRGEMMALAHQYDPTFDESQYDARAKYNNNYTSGPLMQTRNAINTGIFHLNELKNVTDALHNKQFTGPLGLWTKKYNSIENLIKDNSGDPNVAAFNNVVTKVATELAKIYKGTASPTTVEIEDERRNMGLDSSPAQMDAVMQTSLELLSGKLTALRDDYQGTMGKAPPNNIIQGQARDAIRDLQKKGINFDLNKVDPQTNWKDINEYADDHPDKETAIESLIKQGISDQEAIDWLEGNINYGEEENQNGKESDFNQPLSMGEKGSLSLSFESGGNPGAIGYDNTGGYSYGLFQLAHNNAKNFVNQSPYSDQFKGLTFNTPAWREQWKKVATKDPEGFSNAQTNYITKTHVDPQIQKLSNAGLKIDQYSPALKEVLLSTAVQHGPNTNVVVNALKSLPKDPSEESLIKAIYKSRWGGGSQFARSTSDVKKSVYNRFFGKQGELNKALALSKQYNV